jgi:hypothetical protein
MLSTIEYGYAQSASGGYENEPASRLSTGESDDAPAISVFVSFGRYCIYS